MTVIFFFSSRRRHTRYIGDWSSDVWSSDLNDRSAWLTVLSGAPQRIVSDRLKIKSKFRARFYNELDRKSTRLNSSHRCISYAVFCLKKKKKPVGGATSPPCAARYRRARARL